MILKQDFNLFLFNVIFLIFYITTATKTFADESKLPTTCEINSRNISCINLDISEDFKTYFFREPFRIQFVFKNLLIIKNKKKYNNDFFREVRLNENSKSKSTVVLEFKDPTIISDISYYEISDKKINLIIYFSKTSEANYAIAKHFLHKNDGDFFSLEDKLEFKTNKLQTKSQEISLPLLKKQELKKTNFKKDYVVFIDPGHGGKDPGAIGYLGTFEKNITLKASLLLAKKLKNIDKITPILSRNSDVYLKLKNRTMLAKKIRQIFSFLFMLTQVKINKQLGFLFSVYLTKLQIGRLKC